MSVDTTPQVVRFGEFTLDLRSGELSRGSHCVLLPEQPFRLLVTLIRERGQLVTRETLQRQLWTDDTFVDFEAGLNATVKRVREVLGDSARRRSLSRHCHGEAIASSLRSNSSTRGRDSTGEPAAPASTIQAVRARATRQPVDNRSRGRWRHCLRHLGLGLVAPSSSLARPVPTRWSALTNLGRVTRASLSANGRDLAYVTRDGNQESLWIRHASDANAIRLAGPLDGAFDSLTAAPNGFVYYTFFSPNKTDVGLYRVPIKGGSPEVCRRRVWLGCVQPRWIRATRRSATCRRRCARARSSWSIRLPGRRG